MNKSILMPFRMTVAEQNLGLYGIKVDKKNGESVTHHWRSRDPVCIYSASKTFTALAVGMCIDDVFLTVKDPVINFFPEYKGVASKGSDQITIEHLLHMASGKEEYWFGTEDHLKMTSDWAELFFKVPVTKKPGTYFHYSNACTYMLGRIVERVSGKNLRDFLAARLFTPLGIFNPQWHTCPGGHTLAATGLYLTIDEFSKLGMILLNDGIYNNQRLISENYIHAAVNHTIDTERLTSGSTHHGAGYGYQIWRCAHQGAYRADGKYGQLCIVVPDKEAVITVTAHEEKAKGEIIEAVFEDIIPLL